MSDPDSILASPSDVGALGVRQLKRLWSRAMAQRRGQTFGPNPEAHLEHVVLDALGVGLEQTAQHLFATAPTFDEFERWIVDTTGGVPPAQIARINAAIMDDEPPTDVQRWLAEIESSEQVFSESDLAFWEEHGYVVLHDAVPADSREGATRAVWDHLGASADEAETWYKGSAHGIMVQYFQHPAFTANRRSRRIHKAFAQLWKTADLWASTDRVGFNVPEREGWKFRGPDLHWDVSLAMPVPFGTQGIPYLTDTPPEQGAFTLVPGFQHRLAGWLQSLPRGADPRQQNLHALGSQPIGGRAGDLIIWHHALPHGASPNRGVRPRIVQYINMYPARMEVSDEWI